MVLARCRIRSYAVYLQLFTYPNISVIYAYFIYCAYYNVLRIKHTLDASVSVIVGDNKIDWIRRLVSIFGLKNFIFFSVIIVSS